MERMPESSRGDDREKEREKAAVAWVRQKESEAKTKGGGREWGGGHHIPPCLWSVVHGELRQCRELVHSSCGTQFHIPPCSFPASAKSPPVFQTWAAVKTHHGLLHARKDLANTLQCHCPAGPHSLVQLLSGQSLFYSYLMFSIICYFSLGWQWGISCYLSLSTDGSQVWVRDSVFCSRPLLQDKSLLMKSQDSPVDCIRSSQKPTHKSCQHTDFWAFHTRRQ